MTFIPGDRVFADRRGRQQLHTSSCRCRCARKASKPSSPRRLGRALARAHEFKPVAITLDSTLAGYRRLAGRSTILKNDTDVRHIPVSVITVEEDAIVACCTRASTGFLCKPVSNEDLEEALDRLKAYADRASCSC